MRYYTPKILYGHSVKADGAVQLPVQKQLALDMLALELGNPTTIVNDIHRYEQAIRRIFTDTQLLIIDHKLWEYHAMGFQLIASENLTPLFFEAGMSTGQDLAWFDFTLLMCEYEKQVRPHPL